MPLSEHEEQILAEIERQLAEEDPRFVARARRRRIGRLSRTVRLRLAAVLGFIGVVAVLSVGFIEGDVSIVFGGIGMVLVFAALLLGLGSLTGKQPREQAVVPPDERT
jgi:protein-S-isoprenylcysteine O-methyltransferase Ste14